MVEKLRLDSFVYETLNKTLVGKRLSPLPGYDPSPGAVNMNSWPKGVDEGRITMVNPHTRSLEICFDGEHSGYIQDIEFSDFRNYRIHE